MYGPDSLEVVDSNYHLDYQIESFMKNVRRMIGAKNVLFVLTADHGVQPIQEIMQKKGYSKARRIMAPKLIKDMNDIAHEKFGIKDIIAGFKGSMFTLNKEKLNELETQQQKELIVSLKKHIEKIDGIKKVWHYDELENAVFEKNALENFYKNQLYKGRSGDLICMPHPYCIITHYSKGCSHETPYDYDTHVPLILYQKSRFERKTFNTKVWMTQLPKTLAKILNIHYPTASTEKCLPGID